MASAGTAGVRLWIEAVVPEPEALQEHAPDK